METLSHHQQEQQRYRRRERQIQEYRVERQLQALALTVFLQVQQIETGDN